MPANCVPNAWRRGLANARIAKAQEGKTVCIYWLCKNGRERLHKEYNGHSYFTQEEAERIAKRLRELNPQATIIVR